MANDDNADVNLPLTRYEFLAEKLTYKSRYKKRKSLAWKTPISFSRCSFSHRSSSSVPVQMPDHLLHRPQPFHSIHIVRSWPGEIPPEIDPGASVGGASRLFVSGDGATTGDFTFVLGASAGTAAGGEAR